MENLIKEELYAGTFTASFFNKIIDQLIIWDLEIKSGQGLYKKHHKYAYLEIKMYKSEVNGNFVIYNFPKENLPDYINYKSGIKESLNFFLCILSVLKGPNIYLTFEITDASFHPVDTRGPSDFAAATLYTLYRCFDKEFLKFDREFVERVKTDYLNSREYLDSLNKE